MKKVISTFSLLFLFSISNVFSQEIVNRKPEKNVPATVLTAFAEQFPAKDPIWFSSYQGRYDNKLVYEGRFIFDNRYSTAIYNGDGAMLAFAAQVEHKELPAATIKYMNDNFPSFPIIEAILVTSKNKVVTYELGIMVDGQYVVKVFSDKGDFLKSTRA